MTSHCDLSAMHVKSSSSTSSTWPQNIQSKRPKQLDCNLYEVLTCCRERPVSHPRSLLLQSCHRKPPRSNIKARATSVVRLFSGTSSLLRAQKVAAGQEPSLTERGNFAAVATFSIAGKCQVNWVDSHVKLQKCHRERR